MSLVSAILFNAPPPVFHGSVRKIIAQDMIDRRAKKQGGPTKEIIGRTNREKVIDVLSGGGAYSILEVSDMAYLSQTSTARHLRDLFDLGIAGRKLGNRGSAKDRSLYWINK